MAEKVGPAAGYSGTPLLKKLGIKPGMRGVFVDVPEGVDRLFEGAPLELASRMSGEFDYMHLFALERKVLARKFPVAKRHLRPAGTLWVSWPKAGKLGTDLNENIVRQIGLDAGLVDVKVAAIDETWSGLKFVFRLTDR
ncbi:MAG: DUF3052 domain-containing protein [Actinobacteria bacterium]|nr:DUF3052 domain-containing protein [Actinomycetota bacterium]